MLAEVFDTALRVYWRIAGGQCCLVHTDPSEFKKVKEKVLFNSFVVVLPKLHLTHGMTLYLKKFLKNNKNKPTHLIYIPLPGLVR